MNKDQLQQFCDPGREDIAVPFSVRSHTYATDGKILLRVPRIADVPEKISPIAIKISELLSNVYVSASEAALVEIPELPDDIQEPCRKCEGPGRISVCPECDGDGEVDVENEYHTYSGLTCQTCDGYGTIGGSRCECKSCNGTGKAESRLTVAIGPASFQHRYLSALKKMAGARIASLTPHAAAYFRWDGGDGLLLPATGWQIRTPNESATTDNEG